MNERVPIRYETTTYVRGSEIEVRSVTESERAALDIQDYDHMIDFVAGTYGFKAEESEWTERPLDGSGLGKVCIRIIQAIQLYRGVFLTPGNVADLVNNNSLRENNNLSARLTPIRAAHFESGDKQRFFLSKRGNGFALKWPSEFSWIWVERIN